MHYYLITGASRGLGCALAEHLLEAPDTVVWGISRHATIQHPRYHHQPLDLSDLTAVEHNLQRFFLPFDDADSLTLINNAAVLGDLGYLGQQPHTHFTWVFDVNVLAPAMLLNTFLATYTQRGIPLTVLNISSGAARRPIDGWAAYCSSKAALEMLTLTAAAEQTLLGHTHVRIHALSPGVVDTQMQEQIRAADSSAFSQVEQFRAFHTNGELASAETAAQRIGAFLRDGRREEVVVNLRDLA
jgi:benzil reductase ((S)-benzoin forming)